MTNNPTACAPNPDRWPVYRQDKTRLLLQRSPSEMEPVYTVMPFLISGQPTIVEHMNKNILI